MNTESFQGRRIEEPEDRFKDASNGDLKAGDYFKDAEGNWNVCPPGVDPAGPVRITGNASNSANWTVTEHEDRTITVQPSIHAVNKWHGFLEKGFWRSC